LVLLVVLLSRPGRPAGANGPGLFSPAGNDGKPDPDFTPVADLKPSGEDPEDRRVYLSDLPEFDVRPAPPVWKFGKNGSLGAPSPDARVSAMGRLSKKGLSTHPTTQHSGAKYRVEPADTFEAFVGINDDSAGSSGPLIFEVRGDDKVLWTSKPVRKPKQFQECRVSVRGVKELELRVYPPTGSILPPHGGHAVWFDPYVTRPKP
jgi:hypothetical protein